MYRWTTRMARVWHAYRILPEKLSVGECERNALKDQTFSSFRGAIVKLKLMIAAILVMTIPAHSSVKDARPLGVVLKEGGQIVAASEEFVWVKVQGETYMCVIEINNRFRQALKLRNVRELYANWPAALCFNAGSFE